MEPRELWERHAVLAQAFCISDDEVRRTQGLLDEAEARRSRTLAAFAVTVGSDEVVADLLGLDAREVRLARRTVGKDDARAVAKNLLEESARERRAALRSQPPEQPQPQPPRPAPAGTGAATAGAAGGSWPAAAPAAGPPAAAPDP
ncbi:hypothetical protein MUU72_32845, partial [Streptomyces sp. RS10V-4]|nr:hypothetical protein [Streptomyces rhizoryzae]